MVRARWAETADAGLLSAFPEWPEDLLARKLAGGEIALAEAEGRVVGYLALERLWALVPFVAHVWVDPAYRQRGLGRALLALLEAEVRAQGQPFYYSSSQADEPEPQAWRRRTGFEECGILAGHDEGGVGEVFFRKWLR